MTSPEKEKHDFLRIYPPKVMINSKMSSILTMANENVLQEFSLHEKNEKQRCHIRFFWNGMGEDIQGGRYEVMEKKICPNGLGLF